MNGLDFATFSPPALTVSVSMEKAATFPFSREAA